MGTPAAISAAVLAVLLWLFSRRRAAFLDHQAVVSHAAPLPAAITLVQSPAVARSSGATAPVASRRGAARLLRWASQLNASVSQRMAAVEQMASWGDRSTVPLLKRALRDPHPEVAAAAAAAMARFRGRSAAVQPAGAPSARVVRLPRNAVPRLQGG